MNCVAPGRIDTPRMTELYGEGGPPAEELAQIPLGRLGTPVSSETSSASWPRRGPRTSPAPRSSSTAACRGGCCEAPRHARPPVHPGACARRGVPRARPDPVEPVPLPARHGAPVRPLVSVPNAKKTTTGGIYFVDVIVRKATLLEKLFGGPARRRRPLSGERDQPAGRRRRAVAAHRSTGHGELTARRGRGAPRRRRARRSSS